MNGKAKLSAQTAAKMHGFLVSWRSIFGNTELGAEFERDVLALVVACGPAPHVAEAIRATGYGVPSDEDARLLVLMRALEDEGVCQAPAFDSWIETLDQRGWVSCAMEPSGGGRVLRWRLNDAGRAALAEMSERGDFVSAGVPQ